MYMYKQSISRSQVVQINIGLNAEEYICVYTANAVYIYSVAPCLQSVYEHMNLPPISSVVMHSHIGLLQLEKYIHCFIYCFLLTTPTWRKPADGDKYVLKTLAYSLIAFIDSIIVIIDLMISSFIWRLCDYVTKNSNGC